MNNRHAPVVFVSGCFDLLHAGHVDFLEFARAQGNYLIVSVASDATIRALKREPIVCEHDRYRMVKALKCVDECFINRGTNDNEDCFVYVKNIKPDIWVVDEQNINIGKKRGFADVNGVKIVEFSKPSSEYDQSTTKLIKKCQNSQ